MTIDADLIVGFVIGGIAGLCFGIGLAAMIFSRHPREGI